jgi:cysteine desulfuration protein SufE
LGRFSALSLPQCAPLLLFAAAAIPPYIEFMDTFNDTLATTGFEEILADFELLDDWEDRYRYVIELGKKLTPLPEDERSAANKVQGCVSQVWLSTTVHQNGGNPRLTFIGDSDAHIVRGLIAILFALYAGKTAKEILSVDAGHSLGQLHLTEHLTPQRSNGLMAMVKRIKTDAEEALAQSRPH